MKAVWLTLIALLLAAIVVIAIAAGVLNSAAGTRWLIERTIAATGVPVEASRIDGNALRGIHIETLRIRLEHTTIDIKGLEVIPAWTVSGLSGALVLDRLAAASVGITTTSEPAQRTPLEWVVPAAPISFDVRALKIDRLATDQLPPEYASTFAGRLTYDGAVYSLHDAALESAAVQLAGGVTLTPTKDLPIGADLTWRVTEPAASGRLVLTQTLRSIDVDAHADAPLNADARGRIRLLGEMDPLFDLAIFVSEWTNGQVAVSDLAVSVAGTLEHFDGHGDAALSFQQLPSAKVNAQFGGTLAAIDISRATLDLNDGRATLRGRIEREPQLAADLTVDLERLDPKLFRESLSGALSGRIEVAVRNEDLNVVIASVDGDLNGAAFRGAGRVSRVGGAWAARDVEIRSGPNRAALTFDWSGDQVSGGADIDMPELGTLLPELRGDLKGNVTFAGTKDKPNLVGAIASHRLDYHEWSLRDVQVNAGSLDARSGRTRIEVARLTRAGVRIDRIAIDAWGRLDAIDGTLGWSFGDERGAIAVSARHDKTRWEIAIAEGALLTLPGQLWRLDQSMTATIDAGAYTLSAHCWQHTRDTGRLCVDAAQMRGENANLAGTLDRLHVAVLASQIEGLEGLAGTVSGRWDLVSDTRGWRGTAALETDRLSLVDRTAEDQPVLDFPRLVANATVSNGGVDLALEAWEDQARVVNAELRIAGFDGTAALTGRANVAVDDLAFLATFSRRIGEVHGAVNGSFDIGGSLASPDINGALVVQGARVVLIEPGIDLSSVDITMQLRGQSDVTIRGSARSTEGSLVVEGVLLEPFSDERRLQARVEATDLAVRVPDLDARVTGGVDVEWRTGLATVKGRVEVPRAAIAISQLPTGAVPVSADVVVVNRTEHRAGGTRAEVDLELTLKDDVRFTAFGLSTGLAGNLRLRQSADGIVQLNGSLALVNGTFKAFDQTLAIESGRLTYTGSPSNPYVDARASRTIHESSRTVRVGAQIEGPLNAIETTLFSDPSMSDADTLAYLVLGRPLNTATAEEGSNVMGAAIALGLRGAAPVIKEVRDAFGLEELTATGGGTEDLTVIAGKRFNKSLFVRYSYQTFTRASALLIELLLNRRLSLEATASEIPAVDLIYRVGENN